MFIIITNELAKELISALKNLKHKTDTIIFPAINEKLKLQALSADNRYEFTFVINRVVVRPDNPDLKITFLILYKNTSLMRIDIAGKEHENNENALKIYKELQSTVPCPHIHIFDEKFTIAYPLNKYIDYAKINYVGDLIDIFIKFLELNNVTNINEFQIQTSL